MKKLDPQEDLASRDLVADNIEKMRALFPEAFKEGRVDIEALQDLLGEYTVEPNERYGLNWHGKSEARRIAHERSMATLRPVKEESVDWDDTRNLMIEGDNLEVLKLLQKSYHRKVKMIYIDPPYNTGKEFIYPDKFGDTIGNYLDVTGQRDAEGHKLSSNAETSGRYHTNWLNMMYPRLVLARNLLRDDGVIFVSIDDHEVHNLRHLMDEVFGEENFVAMIAWKGKVSPANDARWFSNDHDCILLYARRKNDWKPNRLPRTVAQREYYTNPDNDSRGPWSSATYTCNKSKDERPNLYYAINNPNTGEAYWPSETAVWRFSVETTKTLAAEARLYWGKDGTASKPRLKKFLREARGVVPRSVWDHSDAGSTQEATIELKTILPHSGFDTAKPTRLVRQMLRIGSFTKKDDVILDFFAGSGTTGDAVMQLNAEDGGNRRYILVQLPEETGSEDYLTIADITKARLRAAGKAIRAELDEKEGEEPDTGGETGVLPGLDRGEEDAGEEADKHAPDLGFRVFKLDHSNIVPWRSDVNEKAALEEQLDLAVENVREERTDEDVLFELLLKYGLDLSLPTETREVAGREVFVLGAGALIVCLERSISLDVVDGIVALRQELDVEVGRVVFRDESFETDTDMTNALQILHAAGVHDVRSL